MTTRITALLCILTGWLVFQFQGYRYGERIALMQRELSEANLAFEQSAREVEHLAQRNFEAVSIEDTDRKDEVKVVTKIIKQEVIRYVASNTDTDRCSLSNDWVRNHDAAARVSEGAATKPRMDESATEVKDANALIAVTDNYLAYAELAANHIALRDYVRDVVLPVCGVGSK
tara:strand:- start:1282 stop:1800 length:519 start_codon:yes stop_codon:yes gene_type:complete